MKTINSKLLTLTTSCIVATMLYGCGLSRVLLADFDQYPNTPANELLETSIPGIPDGDRIDNVQPSVFVVSGPLPGKDLRIEGQLDFITADHNTPDLYQISWTGSREQFDTGNSEISFLDNNGHEALVLRFNGQTVRQLTGDDLEPPPFQSSSTAQHNITVAINMGGVGSVDVTYQEAGDEPIAHNNLKLRDPHFSHLRAIHCSGNSSATYYLDDLNVFAKAN